MSLNIRNLKASKQPKKPELIIPPNPPIEDMIISIQKSITKSKNNPVWHMDYLTYFKPDDFKATFTYEKILPRKE